MSQKGGDIDDLAICRTIFILPVFSELLDKVIHGRLTNVLDKHFVLSD